METKRNSSPTRPILSQTQNNTTLWIGHLSNETNDHLAGQTFTCPVEGLLNNIQVFSQAVPLPGNLKLSLHEFDCTSKSWGRSIAEAGLELQKSDEARWIRFELEPVVLKQNACYGFRLHSDNACIGLGEAASSAHKPFGFGQSWIGNNHNKIGEYFNYFSLAFKVEMCA